MDCWKPSNSTIVNKYSISVVYNWLNLNPWIVSNFVRDLLQGTQLIKHGESRSFVRDNEAWWKRVNSVVYSKHGSESTQLLTELTRWVSCGPNHEPKCKSMVYNFSFEFEFIFCGLQLIEFKSMYILSFFGTNLNPCTYWSSLSFCVNSFSLCCVYGAKCVYGANCVYCDYNKNYGELWKKQVNYSKSLWERFTKNEHFKDLRRKRVLWIFSLLAF